MLAKLCLLQETLQRLVLEQDFEAGMEVARAGGSGRGAQDDSAVAEVEAQRERWGLAGRGIFVAMGAVPRTTSAFLNELMRVGDPEQR